MDATARGTREGTPFTGSYRRSARTIAFLALLTAVLSLTGCRWWPRQQQAEIPVYSETSSKQELIRALNANIEPLAAWRCTNARVIPRGGILGLVALTAHVAVERPRNFRMRVGAMGKSMADLGSNDERFWFWFDGNPDRRTFTVRHEDTEYAQRRLQIPFEPDWLLEVLGVVPLDPDEFQMIDEGGDRGTVSLVSERMTAGGRIVRRVILVDARHRVIIGHALFDGSQNSRGLIAKATLSNYRQDHETGLVLPARIDLDWPQAELSLTMILNQVDVNPTHLPEQMWAMPEIPNYPLYEIAAAGTNPGGTSRTALPFHAGSDFASGSEPNDGTAAVSDQVFPATWPPANGVMPHPSSHALQTGHSPFDREVR